MNDKPIDQWTKAELINFLREEFTDFLIERFGNIQNVKVQLESINSEIETLKTDTSTAKESLSRTVQETQAHIKAVIVSIDSALPETHGKADTTKKSIDGILQSTKAHSDTTKQSMDGVLQSTQAHSETTKQSINGVLQSTQAHSNTIKESITGVLQATQVQADKLRQALDSEANDLTKKITHYHDLVFSGSSDAEGNSVPSIEKQLNDFIDEQKQKFKTLYDTRNAEIASLLPKAGAAGLAGAYYDAKKRYGAVTGEKDMDKEKAGKPDNGETPENPDKKTWGVPINMDMKGLAFYTLFIAPLATIALSIMLNPVTGSFDSAAWLNRFFVATPLFAISIFGLNSIRLNRRLYEEYNHKQRVMQLYHSFKDQIDGNETKEQKQKLIDIMLENVGDKPSLAAHSGKERVEHLSLFKGLFSLTRRSKSSSGDNTQDTKKP